MRSRPWLKFYPSDWRSDPKLRMCSVAARGLWIELIAIMHEAEPYGHLLINGNAPTERQIAGLCGCTERQAKEWMAELKDAGVYSLTDNLVVYSRRMVRDREKEEQDKANGKSGGNPSLMPWVNPPDKAHMLEARLQKPEKKERAARDNVEFETWYAAYPKKVAPALALRAYLKARLKADAATLLAGIDRYRQTKPAYADWAHPASWLNAERWLDEAAPQAGNGHATNGKLRHMSVAEKRDLIRAEEKRLGRPTTTLEDRQFFTAMGVNPHDD